MNAFADLTTRNIDPNTHNNHTFSYFYLIPNNSYIGMLKGVGDTFLCDKNELQNTDKFIDLFWIVSGENMKVFSDNNLWHEGTKEEIIAKASGICEYYRFPTDGIFSDANRQHFDENSSISSTSYNKSHSMFINLIEKYRLKTGLIINPFGHNSFIIQIDDITYYPLTTSFSYDKDEKNYEIFNRLGIHVDDNYTMFDLISKVVDKLNLDWTIGNIKDNTSGFKDNSKSLIVMALNSYFSKYNMIKYTFSLSEYSDLFFKN